MDREIEISKWGTSSVNKVLFSSLLDEQNILNLLPEAIYVCDMAGIIQKYNEQAVLLWGRRPAIGDMNERFNGAWKLYRTDGTYLPHDQAPVAACLKDGIGRNKVELIMERPDLSRIHVQMNIIPVKDHAGIQVGVLNCFNDITEQRNTEKELLQKTVELQHYNENAMRRKSEDLEKSEERYHKMIEEVEDYAILLLNTEGIVQNWNKGAEKIKGYKEEEIVGHSFEEFYLPEDRAIELPLQLLKQARETGKAIHEGWRKRKDGSAFWGSIVLTALHDKDNHLIGFSKVTRDLTERKLAEDKMNDYLSQLEFQNKELEQFVYAASHDLKEPLRKIHFYCDYITSDDENKFSPKSNEYLIRSVNAVIRMKKLIEDLLSYSKSTSNIESYETVNLNDIFSEIVFMHREELQFLNGKPDIQNLPHIKAVPFQIKQLFFNLFNNAIKYKHPERDLLISVKYELVTASETNDYKAVPGVLYHKISITDNGVGFEEQYSSKIFEIFQRLNNESKAMGSGIGLAICKKIVQNHKGFINATGRVNKGASFSVFLPIA